MTPPPKGRSKFSVVALVVDHYDTLRHHGSGRPRPADYLVYVGVPFGTAAALWYFDIRAGNIPEVLAAVAVLTGLIFGVFTFLLSTAVDAAQHAERDDALIIDQLAEQVRANISYAVLVGIILTAVLGGTAMFTDTGQPTSGPLTAVIVFGCIQLLLTIFMVLKRIRALMHASRRSRSHQIG